MGVAERSRLCAGEWRVRLQIALHMGDWPKAAEMEVEVEGDDRRSDDRPPVRGRKRRGAVAGCSTDGNGIVVVGTPAAREVG
jgi:hypothetical protein